MGLFCHNNIIKSIMEISKTLYIIRRKDWREWLKVLGNWVLIALGVAAICFFWVALLGLLAVAAGGVLIGWALGAKITVSKAGKKVGYLRWFTFHTY